VVHLVGHEPELLEDQAVGDLLRSLRTSFGRMPRERVEPFARLRHEESRPMHHAARDCIAAVALAVDHHRFLGRDLQGIFRGDLQMFARIEPHVCGAGQVLLAAVAIADNEELVGMSDMVLHRLEHVPSAPEPFRPGDDLHGAVRPPHEHALAFFHNVEEHTSAPSIRS